MAALLGAAIFVLLIGAANVGSTVLAASHGNQREIAVQVALGAGPRDIVRRFAADTLLVSAAGGMLGLLLAWWAVGPLVAMSPVDDLGPFFQSLRPDATVVGFAIVASMGVAVLILIPTLSRLDVLTSSVVGRVVGHDRRSGNLLNGLVGSEVAIAVVLLTGAGLTLESVRNLSTMDVGVETDGLLTFGVSPSTGGYEAPAERLAFVERALDAIRALPAVRAAGLTNLNPFRGQGWGATTWPEARAVEQPGDAYIINHRAVTAGFLETAGTTLLAGRTILESDGPDDLAVVVLSRRAAERFGPGEDGVGQRVRLGAGDSNGPWLTVVGIVEDVADYGDVAETWYRPLRQDPSEFNTRVLEIFVRAQGEAGPVIDAVRAALRELDPNVPVFNIEAVGDILRFERRMETFTAILLAIFAGLGLSLAAVGIAGVLAYAVRRRTREIGLRRALGATPARIVSELMTGILVATTLGLIAGLIAAAFLTRFLAAFLVGVSPLEPRVFAVMALGALLVSAAAALPPAMRALKIDPRTALAEE